MNLNKTIIYFLTITILTISGYSATYNSSYSDVVMDTTDWCTNLEANIQIYNLTDYQNKKAIEDDLCGVNETPDEDNCLIFNKIAGKVEFFKGPIEGLGILESKTIDANSKIKITFSEENEYFFRIVPTGKYNSYEGLFFAKTCKFAQGSTPVIETPKPIPLYNYTITDDITKTFIKIENTEIDSKDKILVSQINDLEIRGLPKLNYNIHKTIEIKGLTEIKNYSKLTLDTQLAQRDTTLTIFYYKPTSKTWEKTTDFIDYDNKVVIQNAKIGIYSIAGNEIKIEVPIIQETIKEVPKSQELNTATNTLLTGNTTITKEKKVSATLWVIILLTITALIGIGAWQHNSHKENYHKDREENKISQNQEPLKSMTDVYQKAKNYVNKYKSEYTQDQLYRSLKSANVPKDIMDKVFAEEY